MGIQDSDAVTALFNDYDSNNSGVVDMQEVCYYHIPGATWICRGYHSEGYVEPPNPGPVDPPNPPTNPPVNFEELWAILSGVSDGKVTIEDYK